MDKCPFCGADRVQNIVMDVRSYDCNTDIIGETPARSATCYERELSAQKADNTRLLTENHTLKADLYRVKARLRDALGLLNEGLRVIAFPNNTVIGLQDRVRDFLAKGGDHDN